jgi:hypothetical protein
MSHRDNQNPVPFVRIVYSKVVINGKTQLIPMRLFADGSLQRNEST